MRRLFFIDADAHITQQNISLLGPQAQSNVNVTGNRTSVRTVRVSPYLKHEFGSDAVGELRFTNTTADSSGSTAIATDSVSNRIDLRFASGPAYKLLTWFVAYSKEYIDYTNIQDLDIETITASASRLVTPQFAVRANVGYENNNYLTAGAEPKGSFWSIGPEWRPTPRTKLSANTGRRFFGSTHFLDFTHRSRLTTWKVNYSEDISTTRQQLFIPIAFDTASILDSLFLSGVPDPVLRQQVVQTFIALTGLPTSLNIPVNFFTTSTFLVKRLTGSVGIQGTRNTLLGTVFSDSREAVSIGQSAIGDFTTTNDIKQTGASLSWSLRLAANASSNLSISYARNQFPSLGREDDLKTVQWGLTRQFQPRVSGTLTLRRLENDSNQIGAGYTENQVAALLTMRF